LALVYSLLIAFTVAKTSSWGWERPESSRRRWAAIGILVMFLSSFGLFVINPIKGWFGRIYVPVKVPEEYYRVNEWLAGQKEDFKVLWLPWYDWRDSTWGSHITGSVGSFDVWSSNKATWADVGLNPLTRYYYNFIYHNLLLHNETEHYGKYLTPINTRYVLFHRDIVGGEEEADTAIANLGKQNDLEFIKQDGFYRIFENSSYAPQIFILSQSLLVSGGLDTASVLYSMEGFDPESFGLAYSDQGKSPTQPAVKTIVLGARNSIMDIAVPQADGQYLLAPFDYTNHWDPERVWSRASTTVTGEHGDWSHFLSEYSLPNPWDFDYGKGVVVTYDYRPNLEAVPPRSIGVGDVGEWDTHSWTANDHIDVSFSSDGESLIIDYSFDNESSIQVYTTKGFDLENWENYDTISLWVHSDGSGNLLQLGYRMNYDETVGWGIGQCTLDWTGWKKLSIPLPDVPRHGVHRLMLHVVWDLNRSPQGLGSHGIMVKDITLSSEARPIPRHTLDMPVKVPKEGQYELYARALENPSGGELTIFVDGQRVSTLTTKAQTSDFVWKNLGTVGLNEGNHSITLENTFGFNAVNVLALIPQDVAKDHVDAAYRFLNGKRIVHILKPASQATSSIHILRNDHYRIAVRALAGSDCQVVVQIDDREFKLDLGGDEGLRWVYSPPVFLQKGDHTLVILPTGNVAIDAIVIYSTDGTETLNDVFQAEDSPARVTSWNEVNATKYEVRVNAQSPFMLAFAEAYDPLWVAKVNGKEYRSLPLYSVTNGFWMEDTGELDIIIEYKPQRWFYYGAGISVASLLSALGYVVWDWRGKRRYRPEVRR
jgi:hypothetical protein